MNDNYIEILHASRIFLLIFSRSHFYFVSVYATSKSLQQRWIYSMLKMYISGGGGSSSTVFSVTGVKPLNVSYMKNVLLFIHMQHVDHKERCFFFFLSLCIEKYFSKCYSHSESNRDLGRELLCPRSHSEVQYELQIE